ncbi:response regulator [Actinospica durhamensis]|uniref:Response regulator n=1 Tax=Actinospica durhamensis TaxID=1508375 RepID=A0A941EWF4_9ACTN|nr:response regulator [Actinospica durhamensis]MBR7836244.1 response regulator [Actinospica durhamensis]
MADAPEFSPETACELRDPSGRPRSPRVLVVDDSEVIRQLIAVNLELEGFEVFLAEDGQDCLEQLGSLAPDAIKPDAITLDVVMPRLDGFATLARLRGAAATRELPVVMVTACAQESDLARGRELGVQAYLTKPFDPQELVRTVRKVVFSRASAFSAGARLPDTSYK